MASASSALLNADPRHFLRKTKIVATLGPASFDKLKELITAGVNTFRINFSHASIGDEQVKLIENIRKTSKDLGLPVGILGDLPGPKVRCGEFKDHQPITLTNGATVKLIYSNDAGEPGVITTPIAEVVRELTVGHAVLMDDGNLRIRVTKRISETELECVVEVGGLLKERKGINVPDIAIGISALTPSDRKKAVFILENRLDFIAVSFVQRPQDILDLRELIADWNKEKTEENQVWPHIIAKIEKPQAVDDLDNILKVVDAIMVARGDLGVECSIEKIPLFQKLIIEKSNAHRKPVITATQMLESMINAPIPTRAEVNDIANAIFDGTDAVMLSGESAAGKYPVESVAMMASICVTAETNHQLIRTSEPVGEIDFTNAIVDSVFTCSKAAGASTVIALSKTGRIANLLSKKKFAKPLIVCTYSEAVFYQLCLSWGVYPLLLNIPGKFVDPEHLLSLVEQEINKKGWLSNGDTIVIAAGKQDSISLSNSLQIVQFGNATRVIEAKKKWEAMYHQLVHKKTSTPALGFPSQ